MSSKVLHVRVDASSRKIRFDTFSMFSQKEGAVLHFIDFLKKEQIDPLWNCKQGGNTYEGFFGIRDEELLRTYATRHPAVFVESIEEFAAQEVVNALTVW